MTASEAIDYVRAQLPLAQPIQSPHQIMTQALWHGLGKVGVTDLQAEMQRREKSTAAPQPLPHEIGESPMPPEEICPVEPTLLPTNGDCQPAAEQPESEKKSGASPQAEETPETEDETPSL